MKLSYHSICLLSLALACVPLASAQSSFDVNMGLGTAKVGASGGGLDNLNSSNAFGACVPNSGDSNCQATPALSGVFLGVGGDVMFRKHFGVGMELNVQPAKSDYALMQYRQMFYDFNGIFAPVNDERVQLQVLGGIGGARTSFSFTQNSCVGTAVCSTVTQPVGNATHFQIHTGVGVQFYLTKNVYIRPEFDLHYVPNFNQQFASNLVPQGMVWVGYSFGDRK